MTTHTQFKVRMHPELVDELDESFSPMDGIQAIDDIFIGLPPVHQSQPRKRQSRRAAKSIRVYRGQLAWYKSVGFSYVEIGNELHVLELWYEDNPDRCKVDVIVGTTCGDPGHN